jgi:hypothetical protein
VITFARAFSLFTLAGACALSSPARAADAPTKDECFDAHERGQSTRKDGRIREAREHFAICGHDKCPKLVREDCVQRLEDTKDAVPTLLLKAKEASGSYLSDFTVTINGQPAPAPATDGTIAMDTGEYTVRMELPDGRFVERKVTLSEGQKLEWIGELTAPRVAAPPPEPEPEPERPKTNPLVYVLGGVAVVGLGGFTAFGLMGNSKQSDLDACKPDCARDDVDAMRSNYLIADISLGIALVAGGAAAYIYFSDKKKGQEAVSYVSASPSPAGGQLTFGGSF